MPDKNKDPGRIETLSSLLVSNEFSRLFRALFVLLTAVGSAFVAFGVLFLYRWALGYADDDLIARGLLYTSVGLLILFAGFSVRGFRRYLKQVQAAAAAAAEAAERVASVQLGALKEEDFEDFDRVRRLREVKAQKDFERNLGATFVMQRLEARDVVLFPEAAWDFQPGVNVLLGRNGYGKSLLLRAVAGLLQRDEEATEPMFRGPSGAADARLELRLKRDGADVLVRRNSLRFVESVGKVPLLAIPDSRFFNRSLQIVGPGDGEAVDLRADGARHFLYQQPYESVVQGLLYELCLDYWEHGRSFERPVFQFLQECVRQLTSYDFRFSSIERRGRTGFEIKVFTEGNTEPLPIQSASQGTLSVLAMFGLIRSYLQTLSPRSAEGPVHPEPAIVIIDEADAHLHPTWQQKVPDILRKLFPHVQFILSAHSPLFVAGCWRGEVVVLRRRDAESQSGFLVEQLDRDFVGATAEELYRQIFEIEEIDDTYLEYATKATLRDQHSVRIDELTKQRETKPLAEREERELFRLTDESRRIHRVAEVQQQRHLEDAKDLKIAELESEILKLKTEREGSKQGQIA